MLTGDPTDSTYQVRLLIGDAESQWISDSIIDHYLNENNNDVYKTAIQCLKIIKAHVSSLMTHEVGDVKIDYSRMYDQICSLLDYLLKDPRSMKDLGIVIGGTSKAEKDRVKNHSDFIGSPISAGFYTGDD